MLLERVYEAAAPGLAGRRIRGMRMGAKIIGVVLDDGRPWRRSPRGRTSTT